MISKGRNVMVIAALLAGGCDAMSDSATRGARHPGEGGPSAVTPTDSGTAVTPADAGTTVTPPADAGAVVTPGADAGAADVPGNVGSMPVQEIPGHENLPVDNSRKEGPRLMNAETLMRSYLSIFGGLAPLEMQTRLRGTTPAGNVPLFDAWTDYLSALGVPDYALDIPRFEQTNPLMLAAYERIGVALCDRAVEGDLRGAAMNQRAVFRFDLTAAPPTDGQLDQRIGVLHRRFLGYPLAMAPDGRAARFRQLYRDTVARTATRARFSPVEAGWATVCYAFVRHPEFHLY